MSLIYDYCALVGFGAGGWGAQLLLATAMTLFLAICGFLLGLLFGGLGAWGKLSDSRIARATAQTYTTVIRGVPDLLTIYLIYFGGSTALTAAAGFLGYSGVVGLNALSVGIFALGIIGGAQETEVLRSAYLAISKGELESARAVGMGNAKMLRRIVIPQVLRYALPATGNVWQAVLKESALISVIGLVEILRIVGIGAGSTRLPFEFYITGFFLYLILTSASGAAFQLFETWSMRGVRK